MHAMFSFTLKYLSWQYKSCLAAEMCGACTVKKKPSWQLKNKAVCVCACACECSSEHRRSLPLQLLFKGLQCDFVWLLVFFHSREMPPEETDNCHIEKGCQTTSNHSKRITLSDYTKQGHVVQNAQMGRVGNICCSKSCGFLNKNLYSIN